MQKNAKKIAYLAHQPSGCFWYRIKTPMEALDRAGIPTEVIGINQDIAIDEFQTFQFYGAYPFNIEKILKYLKSEGKKIVYDCDDALDLIDETNPQYHAVKRDAGSADMILQYADEVTVANDRLAEYVRPKTNAKITVVPNFYNLEEWRFERTPHAEIRIGFAGSSTHVPDLIEIIPAIKSLQEKYDIKFYIMGFGKTTYEEWFKNYRYIAQPVATKALRELDAALKTIKFEWVPFVDYFLYPHALTSLSLDIGICPLKDTPFNRCRTPSKAMEYQLSGATVVASDCATYNSEPTSLIVRDNNWKDGIERLILDKISLNSLVWIKENRNVNLPQNIALLKSVYVVH